jgi:hypothetical protein
VSSLQFRSKPSDPHPRTPRFPAPLHLHTGLPGQYIGIITQRFPCARSRPRSVSAQGVTTPRRNARGHGTARRVWGSSWTLEAWRKVEESTVDLHVHYTTPFLSNPKPLGQRQKTITRTRWLQLDLSLEDNVAWNELLRESVFPDGKKNAKAEPVGDSNMETVQRDEDTTTKSDANGKLNMADDGNEFDAKRTRANQVCPVHTGA